MSIESNFDNQKGRIYVYHIIPSLVLNYISIDILLIVLIEESLPNISVNPYLHNIRKFESIQIQCKHSSNINRGYILWLNNGF